MLDDADTSMVHFGQLMDCGHQCPNPPANNAQRRSAAKLEDCSHPTFCDNINATSSNANNPNAQLAIIDPDVIMGAQRQKHTIRSRLVKLRRGTEKMIAGAKPIIVTRSIVVTDSHQLRSDGLQDRPIRINSSTAAQQMLKARKSNHPTDGTVVGRLMVSQSRASATLSQRAAARPSKNRMVSGTHSKITTRRSIAAISGHLAPYHRKQLAFSKEINHQHDRAGAKHQKKLTMPKISSHTRVRRCGTSGRIVRIHGITGVSSHASVIPRRRVKPKLGKKKIRTRVESKIIKRRSVIRHLAPPHGILSVSSEKIKHEHVSGGVKHRKMLTKHKIPSRTRISRDSLSSGMVGTDQITGLKSQALVTLRGGAKPKSGKKASVTPRRRAKPKLGKKKIGSRIKSKIITKRSITGHLTPHHRKLSVTSEEIKNEHAGAKRRKKLTKHKTSPYTRTRRNCPSGNTIWTQRIPGTRIQKRRSYSNSRQLKGKMTSGVKPTIIKIVIAAVDSKKLASHISKLAQESKAQQLYRIISGAEKQQPPKTRLRSFYLSSTANAAKRGSRQMRGEIVYHYDHNVAIKSQRGKGTKIGKNRMGESGKQRGKLKQEKDKLQQKIEGMSATLQKKARAAAEREKRALTAKKESKKKQLKVEEARSMRERHEKKMKELSEKKEKITDQKHEANLRHLAEAKVSIIDEEYLENVKYVEDKAELEQKKIDVEAKQKLVELEQEMARKNACTPKDAEDN